VTPLLLQTLAGLETARRPLWIMRQAGRYLPEYRALRERHSFEELCAEPELAAEVTLMPMARFPLDAAIVFADLMSPVPALGLGVRFDPGPVLETSIRSRADLEALRDPDPAEVAPEVMETLRILRRRLPEKTALIGFAGAPLSLAAYLVEGSGKKDFPRLRALAASDEALFEELLAKLSRLVAGYLREQVRAGAQVVQIFDSWAGLLSREDWRRLVRPHLLALIEEVGREGAPRVLFFHGAPHLLEEYAAMPVEAVAVDWRIDLPAARKLAPQKAWQGNLDPAALLAGPEGTRRRMEALLARVPARGHVVNLGHGILPETPIESVEAIIETVHREADQPERARPEAPGGAPTVKERS
jgi:uroporphyrinogen decarboxylase